MRTLLAKTKADGYRKVILWTVDELVVARQYYVKLGFVCTEREDVAVLSSADALPPEDGVFWDYASGPIVTDHPAEHSVV